MDSLSNLASMNIQSRKEFVNSFVSEIIFNMHRKHIIELTSQEIKEGLLEEVEKQKREIERIERIEEAKLITRQFIPSIINPIQQIVEQEPVPVPVEIQEKTETAKEEEKPLTICSKIDSLFLQDIKTIECAKGNVRIKKNQEFEETEIVLSETEIKEIIKKFSELTKIPVTDNVLRATLNNFTITAIISDKIGSRFLIQKMT